ncbi:TonB-dependent receptor [Novosphingobium sp. AAP83]|uniref:TonB-dependent receptor n=1 Tax=Novosphingobium sp. AAP83 TaxID=1523425 RepID=UPI0006B9A6E2|nr:TonB-dependent receptor [Novosphingobium sp. AAP83]KPF90751.1 TonB-dependent receptor [Novosphingobium sp. AAP83]
MKVRFQSVSALALAASTLALPTSAFAQSEQAAEQASNDGGIEAIIVTAQKRDQNVQDVPIAITAFSGNNLRERAVVDIAALSALAPNVNLDGGTPFSGSSAILSATIRGIGSDDFAFNIDPGVGIYLDGVFLARTVGANQDLPDVERIEVLKGPQGTLFGRNTIGGAISIVTHNPGKEFKVTGDLTTGSFDLFRARATIDLPLAEGLGASVTGAVTSRSGFQRRIEYNGTPAEMRAISNSDNFRSFRHVDFSNSSRQSDDNNVSMRGKLRWDNGGKFRATLAGDYSNQNTSAQNNSILATPLVPNGPFAPTNPFPGTGINPRNPQNGMLFAGLYNFCIGSTPEQIAARGAGNICGARGTNLDSGRLLSSLASVNVDADPTNNRLPWDGRFITGNPDTSYATGPSANRLQAWGVAGTLDYDVTDNIMLKSISAFRKTSWTGGTDVDGSPLSILELTFSQNQEQVSQEVQLLGNNLLDGKLNFVLGGFYFEESGDLQSNVVFNEGLLQAAGVNTFDTNNYAFFGQVDYKLTDWISFTVGGRYTRENKEFEGGQRDLNGGSYKFFNCATPDGTINPFGNHPLQPPVSAGGANCLTALGFPDPSNPVRLYPAGVNRRTFSNFAPRVGVQLYPNDDVMVYGNYSEGYKTGGWTTRLSNPQGNVAPTFDEEIAETWEVGFKSTLFDRRLQLNVAAFSTNYQNIQLNQQDGPSPVIDNAGTARIKGFEVEAVIAPVRGLTINTAIGYLDAQFTELLPSVQRTSGPIPGFRAGASVGSQLPKTANWSVNVSPRYETALGNGGSLVIMGDWTHRTEVWNDVARYLSLRRPATDIVNANITYREPGKRWDLTVGGTNLVNQRFLINGAANDAAGAHYGSFNRPREWYVRMGFTF